MPDLMHRIPIQAPLERVYHPVTTAEGLSGWWTADAEAEEHEGGVVQLGFYNRATVYRMRIEKLEPQKRVQWRCETGTEWRGTTLRFALEPAEEGAGTILNFTHADWRAATPFFYECNSTWGELMFRLKAYAEGKAPGPHFTKTGRAY